MQMSPWQLHKQDGLVASLGWVTPGATTEGVTPLFFPEKKLAKKTLNLPLVTPLVQLYLLCLYNAKVLSRIRSIDTTSDSYEFTTDPLS